jgi:hypothetical protein
MSNSSLQKKFIADEMVGKLARLMRMLGYNTLYFRQITDSDLIDMALKEKRTILTRDTGLIERVMVKDFVLIENDDPEEQLLELFNKSAIMPERENFLSRCLECNTALEDIAKEAVKDRVWPYTYEIHDRFKICPRCDKVYWEGNHVKAMREKFSRMGIFGGR